MKKLVPEKSVLIPPTATRVFDGVLFDVYQWEQTMYDGSTKTFEMLRRPDTVEVIVIKGDKILLVKDEQPNRGVIVKLPMGRVDPNELWEVAAKRELREEAGLECSNWKLIAVRQPVSKIEWFGATFVAYDITAQGEQTLDGGEQIEVDWRNYDDVRQAVLKDEEPHLAYNLSIFRNANSVEALLALPEFAGKEVDI